MKKVCLISYFSSPYKGVATLRAGYWFKNLSASSHGEISCDLITAFEDLSLPPNVHVVKPLEFNYPFDQGIGWLFPLFKFLLKNFKNYDVFIFTGGPFLHFSLVPWLKLTSRKTVILDYRDPFAFNPDFKEGSFKIFLKKKLEFVFNLFADHIITVNKFCAQLIETTPQRHIDIIVNGYDETSEPTSCATKANLLLTGRYSLGTPERQRHDEKELEDALDLLPVKLTHLGEKKLAINSSNYEFLGQKSYPDTLGHIRESEICVVFSGGNPYESTTKIYDYLRFNKKILIVSRDKANALALLEITDGNNNIEWAINKSSDMAKAIIKLLNKHPEVKDYKHASRAHGLQQLLQIIQSSN
jgi:hypothetical protein